LKPKAGEPVRVAVRGYGNKLVPLPKSGEVEIRFDQLTLEGESDPRYFEHDLALKKRREKQDRVQFFEPDGTPFNRLFDTVPPKRWSKR
jgi:hypothetical protein